MSFALKARTSMTVARPSASALRAPMPVRSVRAARPTLLRAEPASKSAVEQAIADAEAACADEKSKECVTAWDNVEEASAHASHQKAQKEAQDPMEKFCEGNEDADECRVYE